MNKLKPIVSIVCTKHIVVRALKITLIVGILLNLINQGDRLIAFEFDLISYYKILLTFTVPFCVSMYTAISMELKPHTSQKPQQ